jgi:hypothetical protein
VNFEVPKGVSSGKLVNLSIATPDAVTNEAKLYIRKGKPPACQRDKPEAYPTWHPK